MILLFYLLLGHVIADFALQSDTMARGKNRNRPVDLSSIPPGQSYTPTWFYWLTAHALIHGAAVTLLINPFYGALEALAHWCIDFGKCENWYGIHIDQALHALCKIMWVMMFYNLLGTQFD